MFEPYRRDLVAKSLFRISEILWGALFAFIFFSALPIYLKLVLGTLFVIIFFVAWLISPKKFP